ncbi:DUF1353 domain-containing protein [Vibrio alginolyticus]|uniref:DUF1353 domain-containing protein n=1 Tax=Vibrio alginolyticus TaxID=663 RepID=UPI001BD500FC|nr:DUF1353 domain-containing protein [Vibrio alginolyticus]MBT0094269.1 DUF1353 domain-containing protein [Vibrio alginolyticus]HCG7109443.1 DUF1353 domain-containing protein [Vibrio parahaemolyticus]
MVKQFEMPVMAPVPIKTKGHLTHIQLWRWISFVRRWKLAENWYYEYQGHRYVIPKGFEFDGASIPKPLWFLLSPTGLLLVPGLLHDFGYRYMYLWEVDSSSPTGFKKANQSRDRLEWDDLFHSVSIEVNGMSIISGLALLALKVGGGCAWRKNRAKNSDDIYPQ